MFWGFFAKLPLSFPTDFPSSLVPWFPWSQLQLGPRLRQDLIPVLGLGLGDKNDSFMGARGNPTSILTIIINIIRIIIIIMIMMMIMIMIMRTIIMYYTDSVIMLPYNHTINTIITMIFSLAPGPEGRLHGTGTGNDPSAQLLPGFFFFGNDRDSIGKSRKW